MQGQTTIFDMLYPKKIIKKPIRLIEMFAGYGSQALALKYLGVPFEHWKTCEWTVKSIQAYKDIHFSNDNEDYSQKGYEKNLDLLKNTLYQLDISNNYNEPMTKQQIDRLGEKQLRIIYNNIVATHNLVNIQKVKGEDLQILETNKYEYIMTYSFPCQDLSLAGKGKGMSDTSTRSGMLWEVERILTECYELGNMPQILLMENVPQVHSEDNLEDFNKWKLRLEELGYKNYFQDLIATDYGIPQTRNRCFMVSLLGDYSYTFPKPIPLKLKLKDMLEDNVDEKYYLSDKMMEYITSKDDKYKVNENKLVINRDIACSKTTREGNTRADTTDYICDNLPDNYKLKPVMNLYEMGVKRYNRRTGVVVDTDGSSSTLLARTQGDNNMILIKNATEKGYLEATDGDGIDISSRMEYHRGTVQKGKAQTLTTMGGENNGVVVNSLYTDIEKQLFTKDGNIKRYINSDIIDKFEEGQMATTSFPNGYGHGPRTHDESISLNTIDKPSVKQNLRIRKLTPRECFRLMGVKDEDYDNCAKNQSDSSLYHLAGDSLISTIMMALFSQMLDINWVDKFNSKEWWHSE